MNKNRSIPMSKTAGIIVIKDEILNGNVDENSTLLCKELHRFDISVRKVTIIPKQAEIIRLEIQQFCKSFDVVISIGGVGVAPEDVTCEGIAAAFKVPLQENEQLKQYYKDCSNISDSKLISIPVSADVFKAKLDKPLENGIDYFPVIKIRNLICLPGSPTYLRSIFAALPPEYFLSFFTIRFSRTVYLHIEDMYNYSKTVPNESTNGSKDSVTIRYCPLKADGDDVVPILFKICIESTSLDDCLNAEKMLLLKVKPTKTFHPKMGLPDFVFISQLMRTETELSRVLKTSWQIIEECLNEYNIDETFISFNGGKDCTVMLNLVYAVCLKKNLCMPKVLYFQELDSFQEVDCFIQEIREVYNLDLCILPMPMKNSLEMFLGKEPNRKACFMGLRYNDPKATNLKAVQLTDSNWPKLIRISPILHWSYKNVWDFLRCANIPYCKLYNEGYSSLGNRRNTLPNPELRYKHDLNIHYKPAFFLDDEFERTSRHSLENDITDV